MATFRKNALCAALGFVGFACAPSTRPEDCDQDRALELVYSDEGMPAFAGQALIITSCGGGGFCHSEEIAAEDRWGAPAGLDFDLRVASTSGIELAIEEVERLGRHQAHILSNPNAIWAQIQSGQMPPSGDVGDAYYAAVGLNFVRFADDGTTTQLPPLGTDTGREIVRNWISCGAPVVERTTTRFDGRDNEIGFTVPACQWRCVEPSWSAIYQNVVAGPRPGGSCALARCHSGDDADAGLRLDEGPAAAFASLLDGTAAGEQCLESAQPLLVAGDVEGSLLWLKLGGAGEIPCGARMPPSGDRLSEQSLCAIREWIACGACERDDDPVCADCLAAAREACGYDTTMPSGCVEVPQCASQPSE